MRNALALIPFGFVAAVVTFVVTLLSHRDVHEALWQCAAVGLAVYVFAFLRVRRTGGL
jgi:uncharacterized membrane protein YeiH